MPARAYFYSFYGQDTWRVTPALTLTYGLSYGWQTPYNFSNHEEALLVNASTSQPLSAKTYLQQKEASALAGDIYNPTLGFLPVAQSGRSSVYNTDYGDVAPRIAAAWNPSFSDGLLGKLFGSEKTVIRGGFGLYYDRLNGELAVVDAGLSAGPSSTVSTGLQTCAASGSPGPNCNPTSTNPGLSDFRFGVDGAIPTPTYPTTLPSPYVPANKYGELVSDGIDINYKEPRVYSSNVTIQRDLGHGTVMELGWTGRYGRGEETNVELNASPYMFTDTTSGQSFAQAYDSVANALRAGTAVSTQPWFENQLPGVGTTQGYASTTAYLAAVQAANFENGNVSSIFDSTSSGALGLNFLRQGIGQQAYDETQVDDLSIATNTGFSNYNAFIATIRRSGKNLTLDINYTHAKALDTNEGVANDSTNLATPLTPGIDYGPSHFDIRNAFNALFVYNLPQSYAIFPKPVNAILGGWYVSGIVTVTSGLPVYVTEGSQVFGAGQRSAANTPAVPLVNVKSIHTGVFKNVTGSDGIGTSGEAINFFSNPAAAYKDFGYVQLSSGQDGYKAPLRGEPFLNTDASLGRVIPLPKGTKLTITANAFNLFNNVTFNTPLLPMLGSNSTFGAITSTYVPENRQASSRWVMLGARVEF
jgi:hypothetical protein